MLKGNHSCHQRYRFSPNEERGIVGVNFFAQEHDKRTPQELDYGIINSEDIRLTFGSPSIIVLLFMFCYHEKYAFAPGSLRKRSLTEKKKKLTVFARLAILFHSQTSWTRTLATRGFCCTEMTASSIVYSARVWSFKKTQKERLILVQCRNSWGTVFVETRIS